jgi:hypothetical protein
MNNECSETLFNPALWVLFPDVGIKQKTII